MESETPKLMFDWFKATVATVGGDGHDEYVIYDDGDGPGTVRLCKYEQWNGNPETCTEKIIPVSIFNDIIKMLDDAHAYEWPKRMGFEMCGGIRSMKFWHDDKIIRVSSAVFFQDGEEIYWKIGNMLEGIFSADKNNSEL